MTNDEGMQIFRWDADARVWTPVSWPAWMKFREQGGFEPLPGVRNGDYSFVVCIVDEGTLFNIIPHKYRVDADGMIAQHRFDDLSADERAFVSKWTMSPVAPYDDEKEQFDALRDRIWQSDLPDEDAAMVLIRKLPAFPATEDQRPALSFLRAFGFGKPPMTVN